MTATKDQFFKPAKMSAQAKTSQTNSIVRDILDAESLARDKKTEALRALRLAKLKESETAESTSSVPKQRARQLKSS